MSDTHEPAGKLVDMLRVATDRIAELEARNRELESMIIRHAREAHEREAVILKLCKEIV